MTAMGKIPKIVDTKTKVFYGIIILLVLLFVYLVLMLGRRGREGASAGKDAMQEDTGVPMAFPEGKARELEGSKVKAYRDEENARRLGGLKQRDRNIANMWADIAGEEPRKGDDPEAQGDAVYESMFGGKDRRKSDEELLQEYYSQSYVDPQSIKQQKPAPKVSRGGGGGSVSRPAPAPPAPVAEPAAEEEAPAAEEVQEGRGVVHSMRDEMRSGRTASGTARAERAKSVVAKSATPVRCQFVRDEEIASGQRVTVRLLDALTLSDGTVVPANSRLSATCSVGDRLVLSFAGLTMNGSIYSINYSAYDNDGLPGLYCAGGEGGVGRQARRQVVDDAVGIAQGVVSGAGIVGRLASSAMSIGRLAASGGGPSKVQVPSGYTFYIIENKK